MPDRKAGRGRREYALLLFLYNTGARVSEATQMNVRDLKLARSQGGYDLAVLHGEGGKTRQCPLWPGAERALAAEIRDRKGEDAVRQQAWSAVHPLRGLPACRTLRGPGAGLAGRTITPHLIRHTTACHLVLAGMDINTIRAWLGHVSSDGRLTGLQRTWLDPQTAWKAPLVPPRKAMGHLLGQGVRIGDGSDVLTAGEGLETML